MKENAKATSPAPLILVVDDFQDNREMYAEYLEFSGYRVGTATNGQEAIDRANELRPDVIVMDLSLPVLDGWEATRRLKAGPLTKDVPVIALTGHALKGHSQGAKEAGCDTFLAKPCLPQTLVEAINQLLDKKRTMFERGGRK
jgi:two-component system, cell cycle response regulator DivK